MDQVGIEIRRLPAGGPVCAWGLLGGTRAVEKFYSYGLRATTTTTSVAKFGYPSVITCSAPVGEPESVLGEPGSGRERWAGRLTRRARTLMKSRSRQPGMAERSKPANSSSASIAAGRCSARHSQPTSGGRICRPTNIWRRTCAPARMTTPRAATPNSSRRPRMLRWAPAGGQGGCSCC